MTNKTRKIYIGAAWPYANGSLHLGHVAGLIGADILARYHRQKGDDVLYTSGSDCHGTPIVVSAEKEKTTPEKIANKYHQEFLDTLVKGLGFSYDNYTTTLTENHSQLVQEIFLKLYEQGDIYKKTEDLPYCEKCKRFLPDRYIEGECPVCHFKDARGDQCDECGSILDAKDLINPRCKTCTERPIFTPSEHFFLKLSAYQDKIRSWSDSATGWRSNAVGFTKKMLDEGLHDRAITRDTDWGIDIPIKGYEDKKIYVWFEAVCGYFTSSVEWSTFDKKNDWEKFWKGENAIHYYVHGKDNVPFHTIIWPTILMGYGDLHLPDRIVSSEYLTLEGKQFSKSRAHAVWLPDFLKDFEAYTLRYYLVANGPETSDADFSWKTFQQSINKELIGNFGNFIHRTKHLIYTNFPDGIELGEKFSDKQASLLETAVESFEHVGNLIEEAKFREALSHVIGLAEKGNHFLAETEPWNKIKSNKLEAGNDLVVLAKVIECLAKLINPFLPSITKKIYDGTLDWQYSQLTKLKFDKPEPIFDRIEDEAIAAQIERLKKE